jgi:hypothetical protein
MSRGDGAISGIRKTIHHSDCICRRSPATNSCQSVTGPGLVLRDQDADSSANDCSRRKASFHAGPANDCFVPVRVIPEGKGPQPDRPNTHMNG